MTTASVLDQLGPLQGAEHFQPVVSTVAELLRESCSHICTGLDISSVLLVCLHQPGVVSLVLVPCLHRLHPLPALTQDYLCLSCFTDLVSSLFPLVSLHRPGNVSQTFAGFALT